MVYACLAATAVYSAKPPSHSEPMTDELPAGMTWVEVCRLDELPTDGGGLSVEAHLHGATLRQPCAAMQTGRGRALR